MPRFRGYRTDSMRLPGWDYRWSAWYFVTICTNCGRPFGRVRNGIVGLSPAGCIAAEEWVRTAEVRPYVRLDAWVVMPDHVHGLIGLGPDTPGSARRSSGPFRKTGDGRPLLRAHSLGAIIGQYKSLCTKRIRRAGQAAFRWQPNYHERIIRNRRHWMNTRQYILDNPARWSRDRPDE